MEGDELFPKGFHPVFRDVLTGSYEPAPSIARSKAPKGSIKYYYTEFRKYSSTLVIHVGQDTSLIDSHMEDVYMLGNVYKEVIEVSF